MDIKKFDLNSLVNSVKSMISPDGATPEPADENDQLGLKMAELSILLQELSQAQAEHSKKLTQANQMLNEVFRLVRAEKEIEEPADAEDVEQQDQADDDGMPESPAEEQEKDQ